MGGIARENRMKAVQIGGTEDHVHMLVSMPPSLAPSEAMQRIKGASSAWIKQTFEGLEAFAWQAGYGAFTVGASQVEATVRYILNQETHHANKSFHDEYLAFLERHGVAYDKGRLWD